MLGSPKRFRGPVILVQLNNILKGGLDLMVKGNIPKVFPSIIGLMCIILVIVWLLPIGGLNQAMAQDNQSMDPRDKRIEQLEQAVQKLMTEIENLKTEQKREKDRIEIQEDSLSKMTTKIEELDKSDGLDEGSWIHKFQLGGYGELHANFTEGEDNDKLDFHRLVMFLGYDFSEWIRFASELELEHAFVSNDGGGQLVLEQAYLDFLLSDPANGRVGRILTPLGITNKKHEPPSFNGVERPAFDTFIIPTTWSSDGVGVFGRLLPSLIYEAYLVGGLDGSRFNALSGIRGGRIKERPSLNDPAITARLDYFPFAERPAAYRQALRLGLSTYFGGLDNGNNGANPGIVGDIQIYSGDFEYSVMKWDFRGAIAFEKIDGALQIGNGTAEEIFGWNLEAAYHFWPDRFRKGLLKRSDAVLFVRYDDYNTQFKMPPGVPKNPAGDRYEWTAGINFYVLPNLVFKLDYQIPRDATARDLPERFNLGIGWVF
jgi:hypothetical protein